MFAAPAKQTPLQDGPEKGEEADRFGGRGRAAGDHRFQVGDEIGGEAPDEILCKAAAAELGERTGETPRDADGEDSCPGVYRVRWSR